MVKEFVTCDFMSGVDVVSRVSLAHFALSPHFSAFLLFLVLLLQVKL